MRRDEYLLKYGEIEFDATAIKHFYFDELLILQRLERLDQLMLVVLGEGEIYDFDLFVLVET